MKGTPSYLKYGIVISISTAAVLAILVLVVGKSMLIAWRDGQRAGVEEGQVSGEYIEGSLESEERGGDEYADPLITFVRPTAPFRMETPFMPAVNANDPIYPENYPATEGAQEEKRVINLVLFCDQISESCYEAAKVVRNIIDNVREQVEAHRERPSLRLVWKDFPSPLMVDSREAAVAARCAQQQRKFWEFQERVGINRAGKSYDIIINELGLEEDIFNICIQQQSEAQSLINQGIQEAQELEVRITPTLFVGPYRVEGIVSYEEVERLVTLAGQ